MAERLPLRNLAGFTGAGYDKGRSVTWQVTWFAVQSLIFSAWWFPPVLRPGLLRLFGADIGPGVLIRHRVRVLWPWKLTIGAHSWLGEGVWLLDLEPIAIGSNVCISQEAFLCTGSHDADSPTFEFDNATIHVEDTAWVATQALVLRGVTIGAGAVIGARALIRRDVGTEERIRAGQVY